MDIIPKRKGRAPIFQAPARAEMRLLVTEHPSLAAAELLELMRSHTGMPFARESLSRVLKKEGIVLVKHSGVRTRYLDELAEEARTLKRVSIEMALTSSRLQTSLTDEQWAKVADIFDYTRRRGRPQQYSRRAILEACLYVSSSGCPWRRLPRSFPPWHLVCRTFRRWNAQGLFGLLDRRLS